MSNPYVVFIQIMEKQISLDPNTPPCWESILREIQVHYPGFNRSIKTLQRWYRKFRDQRETPIQSLSKGRRINMDLQSRIRDSLLEPTGKARSYRTTASTFQIPLSTARHYIKHHIGFQRKVRPRIPHSLTPRLKKLRVYYSLVLMKILQISRDVGYKNIITGDESYFVYNYEPDWSYVLPGVSPKPRIKSALPSEKLLLTIFLWGGGNCLLYDLPKGTTMTSKEFIKTVLDPIHQWWLEQAGLLEEDFDHIEYVTKTAISAAKQEVQRITSVDLSKWDEQSRPSCNRLDFVKDSESIAIEKLSLEHTEESPDYGTLHKPMSRQHIPPPPVQHPAVFLPKESKHTVLKPVEIKEEHKGLPPLQSMYQSLLSTPTSESTSISQWVSPTTTPFPTFIHHRSIKHTGYVSNISSLIQLLFGSLPFKNALLTLNTIDEDDLFMKDFLILFQQLACPLVSPLDIHQFDALLSTFSNDSTVNPLSRNIDITRSQFWGNCPVADAYNTTISVRKSKGAYSTRYLEEVLDRIQLPSQPPTLFFLYIDRSMPRRKKVNTRFYFPVYDPLHIPQFPSYHYHLRGVIIHNSLNTANNKYTAIVKETEPDKRWIAYSNGKNTVLTDIGWPQKLAYGDDFDDRCSSACLLLYEKSVLSPLLAGVHDSYTPYKHRMGLPLHKEKQKTVSSHQTSNVLITPEHSRIIPHIDLISSPQKLTTNSDSSSSSLFSSSTSSTLFSDDETESLSMNDSTSSDNSSVLESTTQDLQLSPTLPLSSTSHPPPHDSSLSSSSSSSSSSAMNTPTSVEREMFVTDDGSIQIPALPFQKQLPLELFLHLDNAPAHTSRKSSSYLHELPFIKLPHPPYSPDIAPCDFFLFGYLKRKLAIDAVHTSDITNVVKRYLVEIEPDVYLHVFDHWHDRLAWVASHGGEYYPANNRRQEMDQYKHLYHLHSNSSSKALNEKPYVCPFCNRSYSSKPSLQTHISVKHAGSEHPHSSAFSQLQTPIRNPSKLPSLELSSIPSSVSRVSALPISSAVSATSKPIVEYFSCVPLAVTGSGLRQHRLNLHLLYPKSNAFVILSGTLLLDRYTHTSPIPSKHIPIQIPESTEESVHQCKMCFTAFSSDEDLQVHCMKYHHDQSQRTGEKYQCRLCSAEFSTGRGLSTHIGMIHNPTNKATKSEVKVYCPFCQGLFKSYSGLSIHISKMHPEEKDVFN